MLSKIMNIPSMPGNRLLSGFVERQKWWPKAGSLPEARHNPTGGGILILYERLPKRPLVPLLLWSFIAVFFCCSRHDSHYADLGETGFKPLHDSLTLQSACIRLSSDFMARYGYKDSGYAVRFYRDLNRVSDSLIRVLGSSARTTAGAAAILDVVYNNWSIGFDSRDTAIETLLPHMVYRSKKGACLGVSLIMLMLAEKFHCPLFGVVLPGHFFCRFDNGTTRYNIEPNKKGMRHPDRYYREKYLSSGTPGYDARNLTTASTVGVLYYNLGAQCLSRRDPIAAISCFQESVRRCPGFAEAHGNLALAWAQRGVTDSALAVFEVLFVAYPNLARLAENYGEVAMEAKQYRRALGVYQKGLEYFPSDTALLPGLGRVCKSLGIKDSTITKVGVKSLSGCR